jgi:prevent-host-death family protein
MRKSYAVGEARAHLSEILDEVEAGRPVQLTRRGRAVAVVLSAAQFDALRSERSSFADAYRLFVASRARDGVDLDSAYFASLRDRETGRKARP